MNTVSVPTHYWVQRRNAKKKKHRRKLMFYKARMDLVEIPFNLDPMKHAHLGQDPMPYQHPLLILICSLFVFSKHYHPPFDSVSAEGKSFETLEKLSPFWSFNIKTTYWTKSVDTGLLYKFISVDITFRQQLKLKLSYCPNFFENQFWFFFLIFCQKSLSY